MALDLFRVSGGFQIDESSQFLEGAVVPALDAPVGSLYTLTTNGTLYTKIAAGAGTDKWSAVGDSSAILALIAAETTARQAADTTLQANINTETTARAGADTTLQANIDAEITLRTAGDATNAAAILSETTLRVAGDATNAAAILAEQTARIAADSALDARIDALGNAFNYVGVLTGGATAGTPLDLTALPAEGKNPGDYYKVTTAGYFNDGTSTFYKNVGDGLVWNLYGQMDSIDNTNSQVQGTAGEVTVTGTTDTGYVIGIDGTFSGRVTTVETGLAAEITARTAADAAEITARAAADTTLQANIDAEATLRVAGDAANAAAVLAEQTARVAADATLQAAINTEATARAAADTTLQANIDAEITARTAADTTIQSALTTLTTFVNKDGKVTEANAVQVLSDTIAVPVVAVQWIVHVQDVAVPTKVSAYEVFAASNGVTVDFTRFGLLKLNGGVASVTVTAALNGALGIDLAVGTAADANIKIKRVAVV